MSARPQAAFWGTFALAAAAAVLPLWLGEFPPLVDLPQHAAQVSILRHWGDAACGYPGLYAIHWNQPYWLGYALAWALAAILPVATALRLVLSAAVVALPLALLPLLRATGGDRWWSLLALPLAYGHAMGMGFFSFVVAVPLVFLLLAPALRHARAPNWRDGLLLGIGWALLFLAHAFAFAVAGLLVGALLAASARRVRELVPRLAPLLLGLPLPLAWWLALPEADRARQGKTLFLVGWDRLGELPVLVTGIPDRWLAALALLLAAGALAASRPALARERARWAPLAVVALLVLAAPNVFLGTAYLAPRCAIFLLPAALLALGAPPAGARARRLPLVVAIALLLAATVARFHGMAREGEGIGEVLAAAPAGERLLYLDFDRASRWAAEPVFLHWGMLYAVDRCGIAEKSFARHVQLPVRYREGVASPLPTLIEYTPDRFRWEEQGGERFDLYLIRARSEPDIARVAGAADRLRPLARKNRWWLYERSASGKRAPAAP